MARSGKNTSYEIASKVKKGYRSIKPEKIRKNL